MNVKLGEKIFNCTIKKSKRKSIEVRLPSKSELMIKAPNSMSDKEIMDFLLKQESRILTYSERMPETINKQYADGEIIYFLGKSYSLKLKKIMQDRYYISLSKDEIQVKGKDLTTDSIKNALEDFMRQRVKTILKELSNEYADMLGVSFNRITVKDQKTRWGSCSSKGNLNFNYRLIMAPMQVIRYIVIHEVCHLVHLNHSKDFWKLVESIMPEYNKCREWLRLNGHKLKL